MANDGSLKKLHESYKSLSEASESQYINVKDRLQNIIDGIHNKEDDIFEQLVQDHELVGIQKYSDTGLNIKNLVKLNKGPITIENLKIIESSLSKASDKSSLENLRNQIVALAQVKLNALNQL